MISVRPEAQQAIEAIKGKISFFNITRIRQVKPLSELLLMETYQTEADVSSIQFCHIRGKIASHTVRGNGEERQSKSKLTAWSRLC